MIAILAAVPFETEFLRRHMSPCEVVRCGRRDLYRGALYGHAAVLLHSGVGKAAAASAATIALEFCRPDAFISVGCGGAYPGAALSVGDLALASEEIYGDEGSLTPEGFLDLQRLGLATGESRGRQFFGRFPCDSGLLQAAAPLLEEAAAAAGGRLGIGPMVTVSTCSGTSTAGLELGRRTGGICENMEGAAAAQICALYETPFMEIRGISNLTEDRNPAAWNLKGASLLAQKALASFLHGWRREGDRA